MLKHLLEKYLANSCSFEELEGLLQRLKEENGSDVVHSILKDRWEEARKERLSSEVDAAALYQAILQREGGPGRKRRLRKRGVVRNRAVGFVAALLMVMAWSIVLFMHSHRPAVAKPAFAAAGRSRNDVQPGGNRALLKLSNGQTIVLDSAGNGMLAMQGGIKVVKLGNGQLVYRAGQGDPADSAPVFNTISTPRGGQYELVLQDGTKVWLNSESSLRYPTTFTGKERSVELIGEAYFEVAPHATNPFKIYMLNQPAADAKGRKEIDVLGTSFNVMAYDEEKVVRTTLVEGAIRVGDESGKNLLKPGQQAEWQPGTGPGNVRVTDDVDVDAAVAWKNGLFTFDRSDIRTIMRQLSRWYDLKVTYSGTAKEKIFWGGIQKNLPLSDVLRILEKSGVEFTTDGKNVIVNM